MESARISENGQITIPLGIRKKLGMKSGDKITFSVVDDKLVLVNSSVEALVKLQNAFDGVADEMGIKDEQDVVDMVKEIRAEVSGEYKCV